MLSHEQVVSLAKAVIREVGILRQFRRLLEQTRAHNESNKSRLGAADRDYVLSKIDSMLAEIVPVIEEVDAEVERLVEAMDTDLEGGARGRIDYAELTDRLVALRCKTSCLMPGAGDA